MTLDDAELTQITKRSRNPARARVLCALGIEHRIRPDGTILVLRAHVEHLLNPSAGAKVKARSKEPNWGALDASPATRT